MNVRTSLFLVAASLLIAACASRRARTSGDSFEAMVSNCVRKGTADQRTCEALATAKFGPLEKPQSEAEWASNEATAQTLAAHDGRTASPAKRATTRGLYVEADLPVEGGRCYTLAVAWSGAHGSVVTFVPQTTSKYGFGETVNMAKPGTIDFCTDSAGVAKVSVMDLTPGGVLKADSLLEYAYAMSSREELPAQAEARRAQEKTKRRTLIHDREVQKYSHAFASGCDDCRDEKLECLEKKKDEKECDAGFEKCARPYGTEGGQVRCSRP